MRQRLIVPALASAAAVVIAISGGPMAINTALAHSAHEGHGEHAGHDAHASHDASFAAGEPGAAHEAARTVEIVMRDDGGEMSFSPNALEVKKGEQVRFVLTNAGAVDHEFLIDSVANNAAHKDAMAANPEMQHDEPNGRRLKPGEKTELVWRFTKPGTFEIACLIPGHYESGMKGEVSVK
ncbi:cupredoxin family protein [Hyphomicrobium sp. NDB2Meth4]|uniref:cupredoxin domain-containing protein n=1 Tax=Hyphomicrobium sp. NDB2Meth4 TaxID=1892846 RepID=UPI000A7C1C79|nr:cupredoxin family protein [Hyphomicrobium sp. NDB2Meth4]